MKQNIFKLIAILIISTLHIHAQSSVTTLFSPQDNPQQVLKELLKQAKKRIYAAVYMITDKEIVDELIKAKNIRNIDVQIITDKISTDTSWGKGNTLAAQNIPVFVFGGDPIANKIKQKNTFLNSIMHHKFAIIDNIVWCGSFNWTRSANSFNREDVTIIEDKKTRDRFAERFNTLKTECILLKQQQRKSLACNNKALYLKKPITLTELSRLYKKPYYRINTF